MKSIDFYTYSCYYIYILKERREACGNTRDHSKSPSDHCLQRDGHVLDKAIPKGLPRRVRAGASAPLLPDLSIPRKAMKNKLTDKILTGACIVSCLLAYLSVPYTAVTALDVFVLITASLALLTILAYQICRKRCK